MASTKISGLAAYTSVDTSDLVCVVDTSDTSMAASGTDKKATISQLRGVAGTDYVTPGAPGSGSIAESQVTNLVSDLAGKLSSTLTSAHIFVGNGSNVATDVAMSGDATISNTGAVTVTKIGGTTFSLPVSVANGGTGDASLTAYAVLCGGTTSTGAVQSIAGVGTSGQVLTSNGAGALPTFQANQGKRPFTAILGGGTTPSDVATGTNATGNYLVCSKAGTFQRWDMSAVTAPVGASMVIDVMKSSNQGSTWTSLWATNPSNRPTLTTTSNSGGGTSFDTTTYSAGDWLRFDVISVGSTTAGQGVTLEIDSNMNL